MSVAYIAGNRMLPDTLQLHSFSDILEFELSEIKHSSEVTLSDHGSGAEDGLHGNEATCNYCGQLVHSPRISPVEFN